VSAKTESKSSAKVLAGPNTFKIFKGCKKRDYKTVNIFRVTGYRNIDSLPIQIRSHRRRYDFYDQVVSVTSQWQGYLGLFLNRMLVIELGQQVLPVS
jgi:hypothetical protein